MRKLPCFLAVACCVCAFAGDEVPPAAESEPASAPTQAAQPEARKAADLRESPFDLRNKRLTGDWWGARPWLEERGVEFNLGLTSIFQQNARGGLRTRNAHRVSGSHDAELTLDLGAMDLVKGGRLYALAEGSWDYGVSRYVGDLFGVNTDAAGPQEVQLTELWYEQSFFDDRLRIRFGKLDLTIDFDTNAYANDETVQFLNGGLVNTANIPFPDPGHGLQLVATPCDWFYFAAGVADAEADVRETGFRTAYHGANNVFSIYEFGLTPTFESPWGRLPGNYRFGLWYDPQPKPVFFNDLGGPRRTVPLRRDDTGFYASFDQAIFRENPSIEGDEQGLGMFFRYGYAHADVNAIANFWSLGAQYRGLIPTRDDDVLAFGVAQGILSEQMRRTGADPHRETALELYYSLQLFPWLWISPDFQWILRPGGENGRDAFVAGLRLQMAF